MLTGIASSGEPDEGTVKGERRDSMLWTIIAILLVLWLLGLIGNIGGGLIWLLLVIAAIVLLFQLLSGRRTV
jgi:nitrate reductase NapE component